VTFTL